MDTVTFTPSWLDPKAQADGLARLKELVAEIEADDAEALAKLEKQIADAEAIIAALPKDPPAFQIQLASITDRDDFEAELDGRWNAAEVQRYELRDLAIGGIRALLDGDDADQLIQLIQSEYGGEKLEPGEAAQVREVFDLLREHWPPYATAAAAEARRNRILPTAAFMRWVTGWQHVIGTDGEPLEYVRDKRGDIPDAVLRKLPPNVIRAVGIEAFRVQYGIGETKN